MNLQDLFIKPPKIQVKPWQIGSKIINEIPENGVALFYCGEYRGGTTNQNNIQTFNAIRKEIYNLSALDFSIPIADLGDLVLGKTHKDTLFILEEVFSACLYQNTIPIIIGGSNDLSYAMAQALHFHHKNIKYTQINPNIEISEEGDEINEQNFLQKIFNSKTLNISDYHHLAYQKHLNELDVVKLMKSVEFDVIRLAEMMENIEKVEPFFRRADMVTLNCDAVESFGEPFSMNPQVNGLNKREICKLMKEIGLGEKLRIMGIFNYNISASNKMNHQLFAQMIWYLLEGLDTQNSHPKTRTYETFWVMIDDKEYAFQRDTLSGLWYFGHDKDIQKCIPCSQYDYDLAKKGKLDGRLLKKF